VKSKGRPGQGPNWAVEPYDDDECAEIWNLNPQGEVRVNNLELVIKTCNCPTMNFIGKCNKCYFYVQYSVRLKMAKDELLAIFTVFCKFFAAAVKRWLYWQLDGQLDSLEPT
jgi:hypothetical protein